MTNEASRRGYCGWGDAFDLARTRHGWSARPRLTDRCTAPLRVRNALKRPFGTDELCTLRYSPVVTPCVPMDQQVALFVCRSHFYASRCCGEAAASAPCAVIVPARAACACRTPRFDIWRLAVIESWPTGRVTGKGRWPIPRAHLDLLGRARRAAIARRVEHWSR